jgi:hypothetical protein
MSDFREIEAGGKPFKRAYVAIMLWFVGRAIQAAVRVDGAVRREFAELPNGFTFALGVMPAGPWMIVGKDEEGRVRYLGWKMAGRKIDLALRIKSLEAAILLFTFQEGNATAAARDRLVVDGDVPAACAAIRILEIVEVYLLFKPIAKLAVKRYPRWPLGRLLAGRLMVYTRTVLGI